MKTAMELVNPRVFELPTARDNIFFDVVHQELMRDPVNHIKEFLQEKLSTGVKRSAFSDPQLGPDPRPSNLVIHRDHLMIR